MRWSHMFNLAVPRRRRSYHQSPHPWGPACPLATQLQGFAGRLPKTLPQLVVLSVRSRGLELARTASRSDASSDHLRASNKMIPQTC